jgi:hypothetical protein
LLLKVNENESGAFQATATISTAISDPLVTMVQRGDGQDANAFADVVVGYVAAGGNSFTWSAPTVTIGSAGKTAVISATGRPSGQSPMPSTVQLDVVAYSLPSTIQVITQRRIISGVSQSSRHGKVKSETAHSLKTDSFSGTLQISLQPGSTQPFANPPGPAGSHLVARAASKAWGLLSGFAGMLVAAGAWIAMLFASRMGAFGAVGRGPAWRRMERILGAAVVAHLVISVITVAWGPRERKPSASRRRYVIYRGLPRSPRRHAAPSSDRDQPATTGMKKAQCCQSSIACRGDSGSVGVRSPGGIPCGRMDLRCPADGAGNCGRFAARGSG